MQVQNEARVRWAKVVSDRAPPPPPSCVRELSGLKVPVSLASARAMERTGCGVIAILMACERRKPAADSSSCTRQENTVCRRPGTTISLPATTMARGSCRLSIAFKVSPQYRVTVFQVPVQAVIGRVMCPPELCGRGSQCRHAVVTCPPLVASLASASLGRRDPV